MLVRTRFAPSPTGVLHIGSVRTALFSWLYARHHQGQFILRIEDTDQARSTHASCQAIIDALAWLGLDYDQGPFYQMSRLGSYQRWADYLMDNHLAYRCDCTPERLNQLRETQRQAKQKPRYDGHCRDRGLSQSHDGFFSVRFLTPHSGKVQFNDQVYGEIAVECAELDDWVMLRSDGLPTYNFAVVIDDWDMGITHVIRGDDHINNTPKQCLLLKALGAPIPVYAHLPMIIGGDGKRLSKRHGAVNILDYREQGYLPDALLNYLLRLGWSHGNQELFTRKEMMRLFNLSAVQHSQAAFNQDKCAWINQQHMKKLTPEVEAAFIEQAQHAGISIQSSSWLKELIHLQADRCKTLKEILDKSLYFFQPISSYDEIASAQYLTANRLPPLKTLWEKWTLTKTWSKENLYQDIQEVAKIYASKFPELAQALRIMMTGHTQSPSIDAILYLMGQAEVNARLAQGISWIADSVSV